MKFINIHTHNQVTSKAETLSILSLSMLDFNQNLHIEADALSIGIHPWYIRENNVTNELKELSEVVKSKKVIAVGECGLDRSKGGIASIETQKTYLLKQINIAQEQNLPLIIHCVRAYADFMEILKKPSNSVFIFHDYTANKLITNALLKSNCYFSFGSRLIHSQKTKDCFEQIELNKCFFETDDSEYNIEFIYNCASQIKKITMDELKFQIMENYRMVFK